MSTKPSWVLRKLTVAFKVSHLQALSWAIPHMESVTSPLHNKLGRKYTAHHQCLREGLCDLLSGWNFVSALYFLYSSSFIQLQEMTS